METTKTSINPEEVFAKFAADCKKVDEKTKAAIAAERAIAQSRLAQFNQTISLVAAECKVLDAIRSKSGKDAKNFVDACLQGEGVENSAVTETEDWKAEFVPCTEGLTIRIRAKRFATEPQSFVVLRAAGEVYCNPPLAIPENFRVGVSFYSYANLAEFVGHSVNPYLVALHLWLKVVTGYYAAIFNDAEMTEQDSHCADVKSGETVDYIIGEITPARACKSTDLCF